MSVQQSFQRIGVRKNWIGVHITQHLPESIDEQVWIRCCAYKDIAIAETAERVWNKCLRLDGLLQSNIPEITDDAHDLKIGIVRSSGNLIENIEFDLLADGILVREILIGQRLIDYGDAATGSYIGRRDQSSPQQAQAQGLEISFTAGFETSRPMLVVRFARNSDILSPRSAFYRPAECGCSVHNTGNRGNASKRYLKIRALTLR